VAAADVEAAEIEPRWPTPYSRSNWTASGYSFSGQLCATTEATASPKPINSRLASSMYVSGVTTLSQRTIHVTLQQKEGRRRLRNRWRCKVTLFDGSSTTSGKGTPTSICTRCGSPLGRFVVIICRKIVWSPITGNLRTGSSAFAKPKSRTVTVPSGRRRHYERDASNRARQVVARSFELESRPESLAAEFISYDRVSESVKVESQGRAAWYRKHRRESGVRRKESGS